MRIIGFTINEDIIYYIKETCRPMKEIMSSCMNITSGVPKGSLLGHIDRLLFLLYLNDLGNVLNKLKLIMFAYDTNSFLSHNSLETLYDIMNSELEQL